jgi:hypothetical protein
MPDAALCRQLTDIANEGANRGRGIVRANLRLAQEPPIHDSLSFSALLFEVLQEQVESGLLDLVTHRPSSH